MEHPCEDSTRHCSGTRVRVLNLTSHHIFSLSEGYSGRDIMLISFKHCHRYLHEVCLPSVVHKNFKSSNILLDEEHNAHLSDCGLAALTPNNERQASIIQIHFSSIDLVQILCHVWHL
jgi:serine/threonine protein kinase